jgi:hypothetical protein
MNVTEMVEAMHDTHLPSEPDLARVVRQGRRIAARRRAGLPAVVAAVVTLVAGPWVVLADGNGHEPGPSSGISKTDNVDDSHEVAFETTAPLGTPVAGVAETEMKFYVPPSHVRSVGAMAFWSEAGAGAGELAYGARLIDKDGSLRRAGYLRVPVLPARGGKPIRVPGQGPDEPTYVGLVPLPDGAAASGYRIRVQGADTAVLKGTSAEVVAGRLLIWVTALTGSEPGIDLQAFTVRDANHHVVARGTFPK